MTDLGLFVTTCIFLLIVYDISPYLYVIYSRLVLFSKQLMSKLAFTCYILPLIKFVMTNLS